MVLWIGTDLFLFLTNTGYRNMALCTSIFYFKPNILLSLICPWRRLTNGWTQNAGGTTNAAVWGAALRGSMLNVAWMIRRCSLWHTRVNITIRECQPSLRKLRKSLDYHSFQEMPTRRHLLDRLRCSPKLGLRSDKYGIHLSSWCVGWPPDLHVL